MYNNLTSTISSLDLAHNQVMLTSEKDYFSKKTYFKINFKIKNSLSNSDYNFMISVPTQKMRVKTLMNLLKKSNLKITFSFTFWQKYKLTSATI